MIMKFHCTACGKDFVSEPMTSEKTGLTAGFHTHEADKKVGNTYRELTLYKCFPHPSEQVNRTCRLCRLEQGICVCPAIPYPHIYRVGADSAKQDGTIGVKTFYKGRQYGKVRLHISGDDLRQKNRLFEDLEKELVKEIGALNG